MFSSLSIARETVTSHWHVTSYSKRDLWHPTGDISGAIPEDSAWQKTSTSIMARWSSAYDAYLNIRGDGLTDQKKKGTAIFSILKELGSTVMTLTGAVVKDQQDWDILYPVFQKIVSLADDIVELELKSSALKSNSCIDMSVVRPLFEVR
jgi:hypothetical protein